MFFGVTCETIFSGYFVYKHYFNQEINQGAHILQKDIFVDGIGNISVQAGLARIELMGLQKVPPEGTSPSFDVSERLAMSLETMLRMHGALSEIVNQMESKGLIKKNADGAPGAQANTAVIEKKKGGGA